MTLNQDELRDVFEEYIRFTIDASQGMNYCLNSKYEEGIENFANSLSTLEEIVKKIKS